MTIKPVADLYLIKYKDGRLYKCTRDAEEAVDAIGFGFEVEEFVSLDNHRAAMLQGAEPVSQHPELTVWYGSMPETNGKTNWTAILHRKGECLLTGITVDCSEYPGRVRYEADRMRHLIGELVDEPDILAYDADAHSGYAEPASQPYTLPLDYLQGHKDGLEWAARLAEANHPQTGDWLYDDPLDLAKAIRKGPDMPEAAGNSPAIPDGYALVPVEPTAEMISSGIAAHYERSNIQIHDRPAPGPMECAYVAMLAAAPRQEAK